MPENEDAEKIYLIVRSQMFFSMSGPIALNQMAIHAAMELYDVFDRRDCFQKVVKLGQHFIAKEHDEAGGATLHK